ncbi:MAG: hypothetical protein V3T53_16000 [Phycisphaerales bacterium]
MMGRYTLPIDLPQLFRREFDIIEDVNESNDVSFVTAFLVVTKRSAEMACTPLQNVQSHTTTNDLLHVIAERCDSSKPAWIRTIDSLQRFVQLHPDQHKQDHAVTLRNDLNDRTIGAGLLL